MPEIRAQPGRQTQFLSSPADIVIYGGAAGGGKTYGLLLEGRRYSDVKGMTGTIFRRSYPEITNPGGLWPVSYEVYGTGATPHEGELSWTWPSGAVLEFNHMQNDKALLKYDGAQLGFIGFDQLEHFTARQFWYMFIRNRSTCGVVPYIRGTCNPDPDSFLVNGPSGWGSGLISWWIDDDGWADLDRAGVIRWFVRRNESLRWGDTKEELLKLYPGSRPKSITFIPATVYDNQVLLDTNPDYLGNLEALPYVDRLRFLGDREKGGNWKVRPEAGKVFNRAWFPIVQPDEVPAGGIEGDGFDFAATLKEQSGDDPDFTSRVRMKKVGGVYYVLDMWMERYSAGEIDSIVRSTVQQDAASAKATGSRRFIVRWEIEKGSAGLIFTAQMIRNLNGYEAAGAPITGDKLVRAKPMAAQAGVGNVKLVAGPWNSQFLAVYHAFPDVQHDDPIDAGSVIFNALAEMPEQQPRGNQASEQRQAVRAAFQSDY